jgi:hypothetical protein
MCSTLAHARSQPSSIRCSAAIKTQRWPNSRFWPATSSARYASPRLGRNLGLGRGTGPFVCAPHYPAWASSQPKQSGPSISIRQLSFLFGWTKRSAGHYSNPRAHIILVLSLSLSSPLSTAQRRRPPWPSAPVRKATAGARLVGSPLLFLSFPSLLLS